MWVEVTQVTSKWKHLIGGAQLQTSFFLFKWLWNHELACGLCHPSSLGDQSGQRPLPTHVGHVARMRTKPGWSHWDLRVVYYHSLTSSLLVVIEQRNLLKYIYLIILSSQVLFLEASYAHFLLLMSAKKAGYSVYKGIYITTSLAINMIYSLFPVKIIHAWTLHENDSSTHWHFGKISWLVLWELVDKLRDNSRSLNPKSRGSSDKER